MLRSALLHTVIQPKREFEQAQMMIGLFDWATLKTFEEMVQYIKKIVSSRRSFLPLIIIGYRKVQTVDPMAYIKFLKLFRVQELIAKIIQVPVIYFEITESKTESLVFLKIRKFLDEFVNQKGENVSLKRYSTIAIEEIFKTIDSFLAILNDQNFDIEEAVRDLVEYERKLQHPITRRFLQTFFGSEEHVAKTILDFWDERPSLEKLPSDAMKELENETDEMFHACEAQECMPNFVNLVQMGYNFEVVKYALRLLLDSQKITAISHHKESQEYDEYRNIREVIILQGGRPLWSKTTLKEEQTQLFSGMIQAIEMIKDRYITDLEGIAPSHANRIEFLEFGDLKAFIGEGQKEVKIIIRLNYRPKNDELIIRRIRNFLKAYENTVFLQPTTDFNQLKKIKLDSERIFYQFFNPFPVSFDVFKLLQINPDFKDASNKTLIEQQIIAFLQKNPKLLLEDLIENMTKTTKNTISRSDLVPYVFDLIEEKIIQ